MDLHQLQVDAHANARAHGFGADDSTGALIPQALMLIVTEVAEAMEAYRERGHAPGGIVWYREDGKQEGIPSELADIVIRVGDLAEYLDIDLDRAVTEKMAYNVTRPFRHGGKLA